MCLFSFLYWFLSLGLSFPKESPTLWYNISKPLLAA